MPLSSHCAFFASVCPSGRSKPKAVVAGATVVVATSEEDPQAEARKRKQEITPKFFIPNSFTEEGCFPFAGEFLLFLRHSEKSFSVFDTEVEDLMDVRSP